MLVLSRFSGQTVSIGGEITVTLLEIRGNKVRLGVIAPDDTPIFRQEVLERIREAGGDPTKRKGRAA
jgi:carbon storage regulator